MLLMGRFANLGVAVLFSAVICLDLSNICKCAFMHAPPSSFFRDALRNCGRAGRASHGGANPQRELIAQSHKLLQSHFIKFLPLQKRIKSLFDHDCCSCSCRACVSISRCTRIIDTCLPRRGNSRRGNSCRGNSSPEHPSFASHGLSKGKQHRKRRPGRTFARCVSCFYLIFLRVA